MPGPRKTEKSGRVLLGGKPAVNYTIRLDNDMALRIEEHLFNRMRENILATGSRAESSVSALFRDAITEYLDRYDAKATKSKPERASATPLKGRKTKAD